MHVSEIDVSSMRCNNKLLNLTVYDIGDSKSSILFCTDHIVEKYF